MSFDHQIQDQQATALVNLPGEDEILKRITEGEKDLYAIIMRKYNQRLYRIAVSIVNNESQIEDILQVTYIKAYENLDKFRFNSRFSTWITRILINECLMHLKKRERITNIEGGNYFPVDSQPPTVQTPLMKVINGELKTILEFYIRRLPEKYRTVFVMREMENMSISETMECLGLTEANVKIRLNRAKIMLKDKLKDYIKEDQPLQLYKPRCNRIVDHVMEKITTTGKSSF